jgi:hypothetical protein
VPVAAAAATVLRYLFEQVDRTSEDDATDAPEDPTAAAAAGVPAAAPDDGTRAALPRAARPAPGADGVVDERPVRDGHGAATEPRSDAPNPEQLEIADDPSQARPG